MLLERESLLAALAESAAAAADRDSRLVLVAGEAGVGKTALLEALQDRLGDVRWLWGVCDGSHTPRPLGPLFDIAGQVGGELGRSGHEEASRDRMFRALLDELVGSPTLTVVVIEDLHWADESTLDLLQFLGRRLRTARTLLLATYRDDGLAADHPLRRTVGELATEVTTRRVSVPPLSAAAVHTLARGADVDPTELFRLTGGNPFFVTEVLRSLHGTLPVSAREAVLARVARLPGDARRVLDAAAVIGNRVDLAVLRRVVAVDADAIDECLTAGTLRSVEHGFQFRHEIARLAVEEALPAHRRADLHAQVLVALRDTGGADDARLAHHAEGAGDCVAVLHYAPRAAGKAAELGAHREAAAQYERALRFARGLDPTATAALYDGLATECSLIDRWQESAEARQAALTLWRQVGDHLRMGDTLCQLSKTMWRLCRGREAEAAVQSALAVLEPLGPTVELARAYAALAHRRMIEQVAEAVPLARKAQQLAERFGDTAVLSDAMNTEAAAQLSLDGEAEAGLRRSLEVARAGGHHEQVGRAYGNLNVVLGTSRRFADAEAVLAEGLAYADEHDIGTFTACLRCGQAWLYEQTGRWVEAEAASREVLSRPHVSSVSRSSALTTLGRVLVRRGDAEGNALLDEAQVLADQGGDLPYLVEVGISRVEAAWLAGEREAAVRAAAGLPSSIQGLDAWYRGWAASWLRRVGVEPPELRVAEPYRLELTGQWRAAAQAWRELGCPYDEALALHDSGEEDALREAVQVFDRLGATAAVAVVQRTMRRLGVKSIPRGPRSATRADRFRLTRREQEVLALLAQQLTNTDIAAKLFISPKTVDHHVSAILDKMGVASRREAAVMAAQGLADVANA